MNNFFKMRRSCLLSVLALFVSTAQAQGQDTLAYIRTDNAYETKALAKSASVGIEYRAKAGVAIGAATPVPLPQEIRKLEGYSPELNLLLEGEVAKYFNDRWALLFGIRIENKGMATEAQVKNYHITIRQDDDAEVSGMFTGHVNTEVNSSYITLPVLAMWKPSQRWGVKVGAYCSYMMSGNFKGTAYDGYLREGNPIGDYIEVDNATYDFSSDMRRWNIGLQAGGEWKAFRHLLVSVDVTWGLNSVFKKDFDVIAFKMFPIYGMVSFGYVF